MVKVVQVDQIIYGFHGPKHQTNKRSLEVTPLTDGRTEESGK